MRLKRWLQKGRGHFSNTPWIDAMAHHESKALDTAPGKRKADQVDWPGAETQPPLLMSKPKTKTMPPRPVLLPTSKAAGRTVPQHVELQHGQQKLIMPTTTYEAFGTLRERLETEDIRDLGQTIEIEEAEEEEEEDAEDDDEEEKEMLETKIFPRTLASFGVGDGTV
jgi:hypothetical protein